MRSIITYHPVISHARTLFILPRLLSTVGAALSQGSVKGGASFQYAVLSSPLSKQQDGTDPPIPRHLQPVVRGLAALGGVASTAVEAVQAAVQTRSPLALVLGTGGTEAAALDAIREYHQAYTAAVR